MHLNLTEQLQTILTNNLIKRGIEIMSEQLETAAEVVAEETLPVYPERIQHVIISGYQVRRVVPVGQELTVPKATKHFMSEGTLVSRRISPTTVRVALSVVHPSDTFSKKDGVRVAREAFATGQTIDLQIPDTIGIHELNGTINELLSYDLKDFKLHQSIGRELLAIPNLPGRFVSLYISQR